MMKIVQNKNNFLLNRHEVKIIAEAGKNPTYDEAAGIIAGEMKADVENIAVKLVRGKFGRNTFLIEAFIYKNKEDKEKTEPKKKEKKTK